MKRTTFATSFLNLASLAFFVACTGCQSPRSESVTSNRNAEALTEMSIVDRAKQAFNDPTCSLRNQTYGYTRRNDGYDPYGCQVEDVKANPNGSIVYPYIVKIEVRCKSASFGGRTYPDSVGDEDIQWDGSIPAKN